MPRIHKHIALFHRPQTIHSQRALPKVPSRCSLRYSWLRDCARFTVETFPLENSTHGNDSANACRWTVRNCTNHADAVHFKRNLRQFGISLLNVKASRSGFCHQCWRHWNNSPFAAQSKCKGMLLFSIRSHLVKKIAEICFLNIQNCCFSTPLY